MADTQYLPFVTCAISVVALCVATIALFLAVDARRKRGSDFEIKSGKRHHARLRDSIKAQSAPKAPLPCWNAKKRMEKFVLSFPQPKQVSLDYAYSLSSCILHEHGVPNLKYTYSNCVAVGRLLYLATRNTTANIFTLAGFGFSSQQSS